LKPIEVLWGAAVSLAVARFTYRGMAFDYFSWAFKAGRWAALGRLLLAFVRQLVAQNVSLALRVFRPSLPIRPGIVAVPTSLRSAGQLSLLASLMSLTPDTLTMDIDREAGLIYVHWIDVRATEPEEARRLISADLEARIKAWLG
ncbi:MAG: Na+/H+ antiporter subunit E, partial [Candidatus Promineifilaceae bacterium]